MMATLNVDQLEELLEKADEYHKRALWQEKLRTLQEALILCGTDESARSHGYQQQILFEIGGIRRRFGQYHKAADTLNQAFDVCTDASPIDRARILGELGVVYRHLNDFSRARDTFHSQYELCANIESDLEGQAEMCRAIGNEGMSVYNLYQKTGLHDRALLDVALEQLQERVDRATKLYESACREQPRSRLVHQSLTWKEIGLNRQSLVHIARGDFSEALRLSKQVAESQGEDEPTIKATSRFFYGNTLWHDGQQEEAARQWAAPSGRCTSAIALCKEPSAENAEYLSLIAEAGAKFHSHLHFDSYDEQGFSALDYAVLSDNEDSVRMAEIIEQAIRSRLHSTLKNSLPASSEDEIVRKVEADIKGRRHQALIRKESRIIFQEYFRPELQGDKGGPIQTLRYIYADLLNKDVDKRSVFDWFNYISYSAFKQLGRIPLANPSGSGNDHMTERESFEAENKSRGRDDVFIIFISYRWVGKENELGEEGPDDTKGTQYERILNAVQMVLESHRDINPDDVGIWLDCACIDQSESQARERGIDALPLAVTQCDVMVSLVDELYYTRAWCVVEVTFINELVRSYGRHSWWEHILHDANDNRTIGYLRPGKLSTDLDVSNLNLSKEEQDRPKIDFLMRQSRLLGRDGA